MDGLMLEDIMSASSIYIYVVASQVRNLLANLAYLLVASTVASPNAAMFNTLAPYIYV